MRELGPCSKLRAVEEARKAWLGGDYALSSWIVLGKSDHSLEKYEPSRRERGWRWAALRSCSGSLSRDGGANSVAGGQESGQQRYRRIFSGVDVERSV